MYGGTGTAKLASPSAPRGAPATQIRESAWRSAARTAAAIWEGIDGLVCRPEERRALGRRGQEVVREAFHPARVLRMHLEMYRRVIMKPMNTRALCLGAFLCCAGCPQGQGEDPGDLLVAAADLAAPPDLAPAADLAEQARLVTSPDELVFSAVKGTRSAARELILKNPGAVAVPVQSVEIQGGDAAAFALDAPVGPLTLRPGGTVAALLRFVPAAAQVGVLASRLRIRYGPGDGAMEIAPGLYGLSTKGEQGNNEPPLQQVVTALGHAIDVGGAGLILGTGAAPIGEEVQRPLFTRAGAGPVTLRPVARYSPVERLPFGYYTGAMAERRPIAIMATGATEAQTLNPPIEAGGVLTFDPGDRPFGVYTQSQTRTTYSEDARNAGNPTRHAVRVYPLKDRGGARVPGAYLLGFEEASNGDYQDYVFVLSNVAP
jgi:hypothetical protein